LCAKEKAYLDDKLSPRKHENRKENERKRKRDVKREYFPLCYIHHTEVRSDGKKERIISFI
jgi:hypothetical protein